MTSRADVAQPPGAQEAPRLLVLRALGLGDLLTVLPALRALADAFPGHRRVLAAPAALAPLVGDAVCEVLDTDCRRAFAPLAWDGPPPDVAVNLHGRGPHSTRLLHALGPRRLLSFAHPDIGGHGPTWRADEHEVARWCRLLAEHGIPADPARLGIAVEPDPAVRGATIVHPGAASVARRWPPARWAAVTTALTADGERVLVTGGPDEVGLAASVAAASGLPPAAVLAGRTDVAGLAAIVAGARRVLCTDTGVGHLATATGTPSVVLFGPTSPALWGPPRADRHRVLWAGRTGDPHGLDPDPGLLDLTVDDVLAAVRGLAPVLEA